MSKIEDRFLSNENPVLRISLKELFGVDNFPDDPGLKRIIAEDVVEKIVERTQQGTSRTGSRFRGYSDDYIKSLDFRAFGKSANDVNLTLSGDMLDSFDINDDGDFIEISFIDQENASKAHGHITGGGNLPIRDFFGLPKKDYDSIRDRYIDEVEDSSQGLFGIDSLLGETLIRIGALLDD